jgi:hypothetical protein
MPQPFVFSQPVRWMPLTSRFRMTHGAPRAVREGLSSVCLALIVAAGCAPRLQPSSERVSPRGGAVTGTRGTAGRLLKDTLPGWLPGVWMREWIRRDTVQSSPSLVRYLQTRHDFGDVRIPLTRPSLARAASFADLSDADLLALARQQGFVGITLADGLVATWHHEIDFQPAETSADVGRLERVGTGGMYERALDGAYTEHWRVLTAGDGRFVTVRVTRGARLDHVLLIAGDYFYYARNRARDLPTGASLAALIASTQPSRAQLVAWLDCELSVGRVRGGRVPWEIEHSTLPWREGHRLEFVARVIADGVTGALSAREAPGEVWTFSHTGLPPEDGVVLFPTSP